jgi:hypothetical protein
VLGKRGFIREILKVLSQPNTRNHAHMCVLLGCVFCPVWVGNVPERLMHEEADMYVEKYKGLIYFFMYSYEVTLYFISLWLREHLRVYKPTWTSILSLWSEILIWFYDFSYWTPKISVFLFLRSKLPLWCVCMHITCTIFYLSKYVHVYTSSHFCASCVSCIVKCGLLLCMDVTNSTKQESFLRS